jgi:hypothetical protein
LDDDDLDFNQMYNFNKSNNEKSDYNISEIGFNKNDLNNLSQINSRSNFNNESNISNIIIPSSARRLKGLEEYCDDNDVNDIKFSSREVISGIDSKVVSKISKIKRKKKKLNSNWDDDYQ